MSERPKKYPVRKNFRLRKDQVEWLAKQPNDESETIRRMIDEAMKLKEERKR